MKIDADDFFCLSAPVITTEGEGSEDAPFVRVADWLEEPFTSDFA